MGLTSWVTTPLCFLNIGQMYPPPHPPDNPPPFWSEQHGGIRTANRGTFVHIMGEHLPSVKSRKSGGKERAVWMLPEQLPTRMTKLCTEPLSLQLDPHERWEAAAAQTAMSAGQSSNANNGVCKAAGQLTQGIKISCNSAKECN